MGNRVYITLKKDHVNKNFYMHWNGGLDTWLPLAKTIFQHDIKNIDQIVEFLKSMDLKIEQQDEAEAFLWEEENGHYYIDLNKQTFEVKKDKVLEWIPNLQEGFEKYLSTKIRKECQESVRADYWETILKEGEQFFKKEKAS